MRKEIIPSVIAKSKEEMVDSILKVKDHTDWIQLDVMDGQFVPNRSLDFNFEVPMNGCKYEAHLMVNDPFDWIERNGDQVDVIIVHIESCVEPDEIIEFVKSKGKKVALAMNPGTSIGRIKPYLDKIDQVLVMTVAPGFYGGTFLSQTLDAVKEFRRLKPEINIEVDGGINTGTIKQALDAGANLFVSGSFIMNADNVSAAVSELKNKIGE